MVYPNEPLVRVLGNSRNTVPSIIKKAESLGFIELSIPHTDLSLEGFLFPEKQAVQKELQKKNAH